MAVRASPGSGSRQRLTPDHSADILLTSVPPWSDGRKLRNARSPWPAGRTRIGTCVTHGT